RARSAQATVRVWVEGRDDPCSRTVLLDPEGVDLSRPECFSPRAFMKSPSIYKRVGVRGACRLGMYFVGARRAVPLRVAIFRSARVPLGVTRSDLRATDS